MPRKLIFRFEWLIIVALALAACAPVEPQAGATFTGEIAIGDLAQKAVIQFTISKDGSQLQTLGITLEGLDCPFMTAQKVIYYAPLEISIQDGGFASPISSINGAIEQFQIKEAARSLPTAETEKPGELSGSFTSPTQANGKIHLYLGIPTWGAYELGTYDWSAAAGQ